MGQTDRWLARHGSGYMDDENLGLSRSVRPDAYSGNTDLQQVAAFPFSVLLIGMFIRVTFAWYATAAFNVPTPTLVQCCGIALAVRFFGLLVTASLPKATRQPTTSDVLALNIGLPGLFLGLSWLLHFFG